MRNSQHILYPQELDSALWRQFKSGDPDALGELTQLHYRALYNYGSKFTRDPEFIRDCIQELFLDLWEKRDAISDTDFVKSYLFKSLRHKIFKENIRLKRFQQPEELSFDSDEYTLSIESIIIENDHHQQQIIQLNQIISNLTNRQREIIYLRFYQGLDYEEITEVMGLGRQSTANLLYRTLKEIKENWGIVGFILLEALFLR
ncbi:RNA polymerase sigma factor [Dyadobacter diqingensis]|uniref:RNA polymerase sigma factor n=1 Tax=Dyadobacter diqingensis TaxID=2938121 RepID=UPI0020C51634|nr:sigma-70 family RNA polymerase sigma factor [Dyadobacter diqingensis]